MNTLLKEESVAMKKREQSGISSIEQLKNDIKNIDTDTVQLQLEQDKLKTEISLMHQNYKDKLKALEQKKVELESRLKQAQC